MTRITKDFLKYYNNYCDKWKKFAEKLEYEVNGYGLYYARQSLLTWELSKIQLRFTYDKNIVLPNEYIPIKIPKIKIETKDPEFATDAAKIIIEVNPCGLLSVGSSIATLNYFSLVNNEIRTLGYWGKYFIPKKDKCEPFKYIYHSKPLESLDDLAKVMIKFRDVVLDKK